VQPPVVVLLDDRLQRFPPAAGQDDVPARCGEAQRRGRSDAAAPACDDGDRSAHVYSSLDAFPGKSCLSGGDRHRSAYGGVSPMSVPLVAATRVPRLGPGRPWARVQDAAAVSWR
jgi:hypothetical protein